MKELLKMLSDNDVTMTIQNGRIDRSQSVRLTFSKPVNYKRFAWKRPIFFSVIEKDTNEDVVTMIKGDLTKFIRAAKLKAKKTK